MRTECKEWGYGGGQRDAISFFNEDETRSFRLPSNHAELCEHYDTKKMTTIQKEFVWLSGERFEI